MATHDDKLHIHTLGSVQLRHVDTNEIILIPTPSTGPNDPLNWSTARKYYVFTVTCLAIFLCNFVLAGPSVALVEITIDFFGPPGPSFLSQVAKAAFFFTVPSLMVGVANLIWTPIGIKYGRRAVYITSFVLLTACTAWSGAAKSYGSELAARFLVGTACAAAEIISPLTITDIFFLHQRGTVMAIYQTALSCGAGCGIVLSGLITINETWRTIYWVDTALIGTCLLLMIFTFPETAYVRNIQLTPTVLDTTDEKDMDQQHDKSGADATHLEVPPTSVVQAKKSYLASLSLFSGMYTKESLFLLAVRPLALLPLPPVLWATLVNAVAIGFLVVISSNFATAFQQVYGFSPWQSGLTFVAAIIGSLIAVAGGGPFLDWVADRLTMRNGGVREPEMRLPAIVISVVTGPLAGILYGVGIGKQLHWICPVIGIGLVNFTIVQACSVALVYILDAYRPVAGEIVVTQSVFKSAFGFLLSFYVNPWIGESGYINTFGAYAGIIAAVYLGAIPLYFWGKRIRHATWQWSFVKSLVHWADDREVGE